MTEPSVTATTLVQDGIRTAKLNRELVRQLRALERTAVDRRVFGPFVNGLSAGTDATTEIANDAKAHKLASTRRLMSQERIRGRQLDSDALLFQIPDCGDTALSLGGPSQPGVRRATLP